MTLYADTKNGVKKSGDDSLVTSRAKGMDFFKALKTLGDTEYMKGIVSKKVADMIEKEYGIHA